MTTASHTHVSVDDRIVLVALPGREAGALLRYVADDISRRGGTARVLHVMPGAPMPAGAEDVLPEGDVLRRTGLRILDRATRMLALLLPSTPVEQDLRYGATVPTVVECSHDVDLVVVQRRGPHQVPHVHATSGGIAARVARPVVVVPPDWVDRSDDLGFDVAVAVDRPAEAVAALRAGLEQAAVRGGRVLAVHACEHAAGRDQAIPSQHRRHDDLEGQLADAIASVLGRSLEPASEAAVGIEVVTRPGAPGRVLSEISRGVGLLVMGRHRGRVPVGPRLGSVARTLLRDARCPVMFVDPTAAP